jgi:nucleotide-binding universal stress UspA family protein
MSVAEARRHDPELVAPRTRPSRIHTVLLATDLTGASDVATRQAMDLATSIGARLLVVNVIDIGDRGAGSVAPYAPSPRIDQQRALREGRLQHIVDQARMLHLEAAYLLWTGEPGDAIVAAAQAEGADLIVVGTRGLDDAGRFLLGSVSDYVVHHSSCPVLVAH